MDKKNFHVLEHQGKIYSATLNQTSVQANSNKFYIIQVLQCDNNSNTCYFFTRWGRVGVPGQTSNMGPYPIQVAIMNFEAKKREKNVKGNYREIELNYGVDEAAEKQEKEKESKQTDASRP